MKLAIRALTAIVLLFVVAAATHAAPRAASPDECAVYADMAIVLASAAKRGVERARAEAMLEDIYSAPNAVGREIRAAIVDAAWRAATQAPSVEPRVFAETLGRACMQFRGDMDSVLGTAS